MAVAGACLFRGQIEARWLVATALCIGILLSAGLGSFAVADPEETPKAPAADLPGSDVLEPNLPDPKLATPASEEGGVVVEEEAKGDAKKEPAKKEDGDEAKADPAKPAWKASAAEGLRVRGLSCLRMHPKAGEIPTLFITAFAERAAPMLATGLAGPYILSKPFKHEEIRHALRSMLLLWGTASRETVAPSTSDFSGRSHAPARTSPCAMRRRRL